MKTSTGSKKDCIETVMKMLPFLTVPTQIRWKVLHLEEKKNKNTFLSNFHFLSINTNAQGTAVNSNIPHGINIRSRIWNQLFNYMKYGDLTSFCKILSLYFWSLNIAREWVSKNYPNHAPIFFTHRHDM